MVNKCNNIFFIKVVWLIFHSYLSDAQQGKNKGSPDICVFAMEAPDDQHKQVLTCLATGFYPGDIEMNIRLNQSVLKDQIYTEIRPDDDGTFQMSTNVEIDRNHKGYYDCLVNHSSLTEPVIAKWADGAYFDNKTEPQWPVIVGVAAVVVAGLGLLYWSCLKFQKALIHNAVASLSSVPNPDTEQAATSLFNYESGVTLLTGI